MNKKVIRVLGIVLGGLLVLSVLIYSGLSVVNFSSKYKNDSKFKSSAIANLYYAKASDNSGAGTALASEKGGSIYLSSGSSYQMSGGKITGCNKKYGGAIYISSGATFTMTGGTIENCSASYGGAIYIEAGGTCILTAGTIQNNSATINGMDIYVEDGGNLSIDDSFDINRDTIGDVTNLISNDTMYVGDVAQKKAMHYLEYGSYPQTYVGHTMNSTLNTWFDSARPSYVSRYIAKSIQGQYTGAFHGYMYTDGNIYAKGINNYYEEESTFKYMNGETFKPPGTNIWFKVEPIKWVVLNYEDVMAGTAESVDCLAYMGLTGYVQFSYYEDDENGNEWWNSDLRTWLNNDFINYAFSAEEQTKIMLKTIKNNAPGKYSTSDADGSGKETQDKLWCLSYYELNNIYFSNSQQRLCSPTDFALSNYCYISGDPYHGTTLTHPNGGTCYYWTRTAGDYLPYVFSVFPSGWMYLGTYINLEYVAVRPVMSLSI